MSHKQAHQPESDLPKLAAAGIHRLAQLTRFSEDEIQQLHGVGPNALKQLRRALAAKGLSFANPKKL